MITRLSHSTLFVLDYDQALDFYVGKLGFEVRNDVKMDNGFRWVTVYAKDNPELEIILYEPHPLGQIDQETADQLRSLLEKGVLGNGVFATDDCRKTYQELKAKGVEFIQPPKETFYGVEAVFKDGCGNWFSLTERKASTPA